MHRKRTKIICTVSDKRCSKEFIESLYEAGMNIVRINSAHVTPESAMEIVINTRAVSDKIALLIDTKGPEIRITAMESDSGFEVKKGDTVYFADNTKGVSGNYLLYTNYAHFVNEVPVGSSVLIDDGDVSLTVLEKKFGQLVCIVNNDGKIKGRKSINVPGISLKLPSVTKKDSEFIEWAIKNDLDFVAHSFVRNKSDIAEVQTILNNHKSHIKIISKIENREGVENIDEILANSYGIMVARGDLGVEIEAQKIPVIQRDLLAKCQARKKPVIIATQMLHTMIDNPRPTRAEVTDVANAIYQRTDAIMLSGETANGKYPVEAVETMTKIALEVESHLNPALYIELTDVSWPSAAVLAKNLISMTSKLPIKALLFDTTTGRTGRYLSAFRPNIPMFAKCYKTYVMRELALSYGVFPYFMEKQISKDNFVKEAVKILMDDNVVDSEDMIGVLGGSFGVQAGASFIEIGTARNLARVELAEIS